MAFQFPPNPTPNQTFTPVAGVTYRWSGTAWHLIAGPGAFLTPTDADTRYVNIEEAQNTTNRIINGKFAIDQRNAGAVKPVAASFSYGLDRWSAFANGAGTYNMLREADPAFPGEYVCHLGVAVADATIAGSDAYWIYQPIEGYNVADLCLGTANASAFTFAFEVECSIAGTFAVAFRNAAVTRSYVAPFTVAAGVRKTVVINVPGDSAAATWERTTGAGLQLFFALNDYALAATATTNTWLAGNFSSLTGQTNFMATAGNLMRLKNVRLYKGSVDFGPDRRLYAEELALCQRYYLKKQATAVNQIALSGSVFSASQQEYVDHYPVPMRVGPTGTISAASDFQIRIAGAAPLATGISHGATGALGSWWVSTNSGLTPGAAAILTSVNANAWMAYSAEL